MENLNMLLKSDLWTILIDWFAKGIVNYGWMIIVFTICLKLLLSPLDVYQRLSSAKQQKATAIMQPEMDKLQQKYGNDRAKLNEEQTKLYKKYNLNIGGMCLSLLITMGVTMLVFLTLFSSLRTYGNDKLYSTFQELDQTYVQAVTTYTTEHPDANEEDKNTYVATVVKEKYNEIKEKNSWLWVKNVWKGDTSTSEFVDYDSYKDSSYHTANFDEAEYKAIVKYATGDESTTNGYYVLIILAAGVSFLTQFISTKLLTPKGQKINGVNKFMFAILPISMVIFAWQSNVVFTLYIITNSVMSAIISTIITLISRKIQGNKTDAEVLFKKNNIEVVEYSRNYKKQ